MGSVAIELRARTVQVAYVTLGTTMPQRVGGWTAYAALLAS